LAAAPQISPLPTRADANTAAVAVSSITDDNFRVSQVIQY
jgi:hypothetical protein